MIAVYLTASRKESEHEIARALALYAAWDAFGIRTTLEKDARGKPYFPDSPYFVSISHTDGVCLAAVSDQPIGADIERIKPRSAGHLEQLASRFFSPDEAAAVHADPAEFYRIWTAKESFVKLTGEGFSRSFPSFSVIDSPLAFDSRDVSGCAVTVCSEMADKPQYHFVSHQHFNSEV